MTTQASTRVLAALERLKTLAEQQVRLARAASDELRASLRGDAPAGHVEQEDAVFGNLSEAVLFLQRMGFRVSKSKVYADRAGGLIRMEPDGKAVSLSEIMAYVRSAGVRQATR